MTRFLFNPPWSEVPGASVLMNGFVTSPYVATSYRTPLTIKSVTRGSAWYETPYGRYLVTPDVFLVLNDGQEYSMEAESGTETVVPFFQRGFVESAARRPVEFCERLYPMTGRMAQLLRTRNVALEDRFYDLADALLALRDDVHREIVSFPGLRATTREELYRRLYRARDFLHSCYAERVNVADAARAAALSPFHLHRTFRQAFGITPMQFLQARRLEVALDMLARGSDVTTACFAVGFESLGSFSTLVRKRFGASPKAFRKKQD